MKTVHLIYIRRRIKDTPFLIRIETESWHLSFSIFLAQWVTHDVLILLNRRIQKQTCRLSLALTVNPTGVYDLGGALGTIDSTEKHSPPPFCSLNWNLFLLCNSTGIHCSRKYMPVCLLWLRERTKRVRKRERRASEREDTFRSNPDTTGGCLRVTTGGDPPWQTATPWPWCTERTWQELNFKTRRKLYFLAHEGG